MPAVTIDIPLAPELVLLVSVTPPLPEPARIAIAAPRIRRQIDAGSIGRDTAGPVVFRQERAN
jgi:hypothetical protein